MMKHFRKKTSVSKYFSFLFYKSYFGIFKITQLNQSKYIWKLSKHFLLLQQLINAIRHSFLKWWKEDAKIIEKGLKSKWIDDEKIELDSVEITLTQGCTTYDLRTKSGQQKLSIWPAKFKISCMIKLSA